ncbi:ArsR/SmtB family transcription factor [Acidisoma sp. C75]
MNEQAALSAFAALAQETRLKILRLLVAAEPEGLAAGMIGERLGAGSSRLSFHLAHLEQAGLVRSRREGRSIRYRAEVAALSGLIAFLMQDCCAGRPEICASAWQALGAGTTVGATCGGATAQPVPSPGTSAGPLSCPPSAR